MSGFYPSMSFFDIKEIEIEHKKDMLKIRFESFGGDTGRFDLYFDLSDAKKPCKVKGLSKLASLGKKVKVISMRIINPKREKTPKKGASQAAQATNSGRSKGKIGSPHGC